jgi:hypothetical protein
VTGPLRPRDAPLHPAAAPCSAAKSLSLLGHTGHKRSSKSCSTRQHERPTARDGPVVETSSQIIEELLFHHRLSLFAVRGVLAHQEIELGAVASVRPPDGPLASGDARVACRTAIARPALVK